MIVRPADGRICDIARHVQAGDLATARNLVANTPGIDWAQRLPPATYAALFASISPSGIPNAELVRRAAKQFPCPEAIELMR